MNLEYLSLGKKQLNSFFEFLCETKHYARLDPNLEEQKDKILQNENSNLEVVNLEMNDFHINQPGFKITLPRLFMYFQ